MLPILSPIRFLFRLSAEASPVPQARVLRLTACAGLSCLALLAAPAAWPQAAIDGPATVPDGSAQGDANQPDPDSASLPGAELSSRILQQYLLAEMAVQRNQPAVAHSLLSELARATRDPRFARRATEAALYGRQLELAIVSANLWVELAPESVRARQTLVGVLASAQRLSQMEPHLAWLLARQGHGVAGDLLRLPQLFARLSTHAEAVGLVDRLTEPYLRLPEAHVARAQTAAMAGLVERAVADCERALALRPDWETAVLLKAQLLSRQGAAVALEALSRHLERFPDAHEVRLQYARGLVAERRFAEARAEFSRLVDAQPENLDLRFALAMLALQSRDLTTAEAELSRLVASGRGNQDQYRFYLGQIAEERKQDDDALRWYRAVGSGESHAQAQMRIAQILLRAGQLEQALEQLRGWRERDTEARIPSLIGEAQILRDAGRTVAAFDLLQGGLKDSPDQPELLYEAALLAERLGRYDDMETNLVRLIAVKPDHAHAYNALGYSFAERNIRLAESERLLSRALELAPNDPFIIDSMGWLLFRKGDLAGAAEQLRRALMLRPDPEISAHLGEVLWLKGEREEATRTWRDAAQRHPGNEVLNNTIKRFLP